MFQTTRKLKDKLFMFFCYMTTLVVLIILGDILYEIFKHGAKSLNIYTLIHDTRNLGLRNAIIGSLILTALSIFLSAPLGILTATFFTECKRHHTLIKLLRFINDIMLSIPSIIIGLSVYILIVSHSHFSAYSGIIALAIIALPMITRASEDVLYLVSPALKEAAIALGIPKWRVTFMITFRSAKTGLITTVMLAAARIMGESAPLLFTTSKNNFLALNPSEPMESLPMAIFENAMQPYPHLQNMAWAAAFISVFLVLLTNISVRWFTRNKN